MIEDCFDRLECFNRLGLLFWQFTPGLGFGFMKNVGFHSTVELSDEELAFQADPTNWRSGPTLDIRCFFSHSLDFKGFEKVLLSDPLCIRNSRFDMPGRVLFGHESWSNCVGARYYDFRRPNRREPTLVIYPRQYLRMLGGQMLPRARGEALRAFLEPLIAFAHRMRISCDADEVLVFTQDFYPGKSPETEVVPGVFLAEPVYQRIA